MKKKLNIKIYRTIILPAVLNGCEAWSLTLREEHRLRAAFFKLWSAYHKWSSGSALVVLGLTFYEINYPAYIDVLL
jgi:hypothetical protein